MPQIVKLILPLLSHQANIFVELFLLLSLEEAAFVNCEILIKLLNVYSKICNFRISLNYNFFLFMFSALPFVLISTVFFVFFFLYLLLVSNRDLHLSLYFTMLNILWMCGYLYVCTHLVYSSVNWQVKVRQGNLRRAARQPTSTIYMKSLRLERNELAVWKEKKYFADAETTNWWNASIHMQVYMYRVIHNLIWYWIIWPFPFNTILTLKRFIPTDFDE